MRMNRSGIAPVIAAVMMVVILAVGIIGYSAWKMSENDPITPSEHDAADAIGSFQIQAEMHYDRDRTPQYAIYSVIRNLEYGPPTVEAFGISIPDLLDVGVDANAYTFEISVEHPDGSESAENRQVSKRSSQWFTISSTFLFFEYGRHTINIVVLDQNGQMVKEKSSEFKINETGLEYIGNWTDWE
jgi:hypothetical protein